MTDTILDANKNNGLITKIWGPPMWESIHSIAFGYPVEPTEEHKINYKNFFINLKNVLPCRYCRESYEEFIKTDPDARLMDTVFESRDTLTEWVYKLHQRVNKKLGVDYRLSLDDFRHKFETYRAKCIPNEKGCNMPLNLKANSYAMAEIKHAPVIELKQFDAFKSYAKLRGVVFNDSIKKILKYDRYHKSWELRDKLCRRIMRKMKIVGVYPVEKKGIYKNLPTIEELKLINLLCSNICCEEINEMIEIMNNNKELQNQIKKMNYY